MRRVASVSEIFLAWPVSYKDLTRRSISSYGSGNDWAPLLAMFFLRPVSVDSGLFLGMLMKLFACANQNLQ